MDKLRAHEWGVCGCERVIDSDGKTGWFYGMAIFTAEEKPERCELCGHLFAKGTSTELRCA